MPLRPELVRAGIGPHKVYDDNVLMLPRITQDVLDSIDLLATRFNKNRGDLVAKFRAQLEEAYRLLDTAYPK